MAHKAYVLHFAFVVVPYTFNKLSLLPALKILPQTLQKITAFLSYSLLLWLPRGKGLKSVILKFLLSNKSPWAINNSACIDYHFSHIVLIFFFLWVLLRQSFRYFPPIGCSNFYFPDFCSNFYFPDFCPIANNLVKIPSLFCIFVFQTWDNIWPTMLRTIYLDAVLWSLSYSRSMWIMKGRSRFI